MPKSEVLSPYPSVPIRTYPYTIPGIQTGGTRSGSRHTITTPPARLQRAYGVIYAFEPMGKPIGYDPARLQRAYLPIKGTELSKNIYPQSRICVKCRHGFDSLKY